MLKEPAHLCNKMHSCVNYPDEISCTREKVNIEQPTATMRSRSDFNCFTITKDA